MVILCAGMQRSGTLWFTKLVNEMVIKSGKGKDVFDIRNNYVKEVKINGGGIKGIISQQLPTIRFLKIVNNKKWYSIGRAYFWKIYLLKKLSERGNTFVIKTHSSPSFIMKKYIKTDDIKPLYIYRDPRAVVLSAYEKGVEQRRKGRLPILNFTRLLTIPYTIGWVKRVLLRKYKKWVRNNKCYCLKYEDLVRDTEHTLKKVSDYLKIDLFDNEIKSIINKYNSNKNDRNIHFNVGKIYRYKEQLLPKHLKLCNKKFEKYLKEMGYEY